MGPLPQPSDCWGYRHEPRVWPSGSVHFTFQTRSLILLKAIFMNDLRERTHFSVPSVLPPPQFLSPPQLHCFLSSSFLHRWIIQPQASIKCPHVWGLNLSSLFLFLSHFPVHLFLTNTINYPVLVLANQEASLPNSLHLQELLGSTLTFLLLCKLGSVC